MTRWYQNRRIPQWNYSLGCCLLLWNFNQFLPTDYRQPFTRCPQPRNESYRTGRLISIEMRIPNRELTRWAADSCQVSCAAGVVEFEVVEHCWSLSVKTETPNGCRSTLEQRNPKQHLPTELEDPSFVTVFRGILAHTLCMTKSEMRWHCIQILKTASECYLMRKCFSSAETREYEGKRTKYPHQ